MIGGQWKCVIVGCLPTVSEAISKASVTTTPSSTQSTQAVQNNNTEIPYMIVTKMPNLEKE